LNKCRSRPPRLPRSSRATFVKERMRSREEKSKFPAKNVRCRRWKPYSWSWRRSSWPKKKESSNRGKMRFSRLNKSRMRRLTSLENADSRQFRTMRMMSADCGMKRGLPKKLWQMLRRYLSRKTREEVLRTACWGLKWPIKKLSLKMRSNCWRKRRKNLRLSTEKTT